jgi:RNA polymerase sigma factor (sigma-70 family)
MTTDELALVYKDLYKDMFRTARKALKVHADAEDVVQQTFCDLLSSKAIERLDSSRNVRAFIFCKLIWNIQYMLKRLTKDPISAIRGLDMDSRDPLLDSDEGEESSTVPIDEDQRLDVQKAMRGLSPLHQRIVSLIAVEGYTFTEIGEMLWPEMGEFARRRRVSQLFEGSVTEMGDVLRAYKPRIE